MRTQANLLLVLPQRLLDLLYFPHFSLQGRLHRVHHLRQFK